MTSDLEYSVDTETELIRPGCLAPRLVCLSYALDDVAGVVHHTDASELFRGLVDLGGTLVGHNVAYDLAVLGAHDVALVDLIFGLFRDDRVRDTGVRETLFHIRRGTLDESKGKLGLGALASKYLDRQLDKSEGSERYTYGALIDVPVEDWTPEARQYAIDDARATLDVWRAQTAEGLGSPDESLQNRAAFALHLASVWGVRTDARAIDKLETDLLESLIPLHDLLVAAGFVSPKGKRNVKILRAHVDQIFPRYHAPRTDPSTRFPDGQVKVDAETLESIDDPTMTAYVEHSATSKLLDTYVPVLRRGEDVPLCARFHVLVASGRTSCSGGELKDPTTGKKTKVGANLQNPPRKGGVRPCFVPRRGWVYVTCDYGAAELVSLAQVTYSLIGHSDMMDAIIAGRDLHLDLGAQLLGIDYATALARHDAGDKAVGDARQFAKIANFGFPGGLGVQAFLSFAKGYGYRATEQEAQEIRDAWFDRWSEMRPYFALISEITDPVTGSGKIEQYRSGRVRGRLRFTQAANGYFQGLTADYAKDALWQVTLRCYAEPSSALYGCRVVNFVHDEIIIEAPEDVASAAGDELAEVMVDAAQAWLPNVPITASPAIMRRWYKGAKTVRDAQGVLQPWEPQS